MDRRVFLKTAAGAAAVTTGALATPAISQRAAARTLRFVPQADLANFDPIWGTQYVVRNASALVWDTLYGVDEKLVPQRQMVEGEEVSHRRIDLDLPAPPGTEVPRWRACAREGRGREPRSLVVPRSDGPPAEEQSAGTGRVRRPHREMGAQEAVPEDAAGARQEQRARSRSSCPSGSPRPTRSSRSPNMSAAARCASCADEWVPGAKAVFEKFPRLRAAAGDRRPGLPAASRC